MSFMSFLLSWEQQPCFLTLHGLLVRLQSIPCIRGQVRTATVENAKTTFRQVVHAPYLLCAPFLCPCQSYELRFPRNTLKQTLWLFQLYAILEANASDAVPTSILVLQALWVDAHSHIFSAPTYGNVPQLRRANQAFTSQSVHAAVPAMSALHFQVKSPQQLGSLVHC